MAAAKQMAMESLIGGVNQQYFLCETLADL